MPNLVGTGLNQVPTNGMLGGLAYQSPDHASIKDLDLKYLSHINASTADTAVDVFVYDTSRDTDGGAWRKRTQHTSWYNETLNTATRGSRREFPAVAVIVATTSKVTIYDGDDPDLPMWMVFEVLPSANFKLLTSSTCITMLNGIMMVGGNSSVSTPRLHKVNFISEDSGIIFTTGYFRSTNILNRNSPQTSGYFGAFSTTPNIVNTNINDVAMTVLPTAPIDPDTGLQVPTIAVATAGGVSVIKDDGTVVDSQQTQAYSVTFRGSDIFGYAGSGVYSYYTGYTADGFTPAKQYWSASTTTPLITTNNSGDSVTPNAIGMNQSTGGLVLIDHNTTNFDDGMVAYATTSYNTGWQHGAIKGAFLSDTDTTSLSGSELVTNGTFNSDISGWTVEQGTSVYNSGQLQFTGTSGNSVIQNVTTVVGRKYIMQATVTNTADVSTNIGIEVGDDNNLVYVASDTITTGTKTFVRVYTATSTSTQVRIWGGTAATAYWDNVSFKEADPDRSVNGGYQSVTNGGKGLEVFGTVTKTPVATGAELVAYSGWSNDTNYLYRPHSTDIEIGTNDACHMGWFNTSNSSASERMVVSFEGAGTYGTVFNVRLETDHKLAGWVSNNSFSSSINVKTSQTVNDGVWHHFAWIKTSGTYSLYVDGKFVNSGTYSNDLSYTNNNEAITIGVRNRQKNNPFTDGKIALVRFSLSAPSAEQIRKIYNDEKFLFQENANATLYGSSNAVTALAYDEKANLLHVGTSSGRSDFNGLRRINNTTTAVTTAISAYDGSIAQQ